MEATLLTVDRALSSTSVTGLHFLGRGARVGGDDGEVGTSMSGMRSGLHLRCEGRRPDKADNDRHDEVGMFDANESITTSFRLLACFRNGAWQRVRGDRRRRERYCLGSPPVP